MTKKSLVTPAANLAVSLSEARDHLRVDHTYDDSEIAQMLQSSIDEVELLTGPLIESTWDVYGDCFPAEDRELILPAFKVGLVLSIKYNTEAGNELTWASANYEVDDVANPGRVVLAPSASWPSASLRAVNGVVVRCKLGWPDVLSVPAPLRAAVLLLTAHRYENREAVLTGASREAAKSEALARGVDSLLANYRIW